MMTSPLVVDVPYRIQSQYSGAYLELRDVEKKTVLLRNLMKDDYCLEQQWIFVGYNADDRTYRIMNAATKSLRHPRYLSVDSTTQKVIAIAKDLDDSDDDYGGNADPGDVKSWSIHEVNPEAMYIVTCRGNRNNLEIFLVVDDKGRVGFIKEKASNKNHRKWRILQVSGASALTTSAPVSSYKVACPEITAGQYRIRNLGTGQYIWRKGSNDSSQWVPNSSSAAAFTLTYTGADNGELTLSDGTSMITSLGDNLYPWSPTINGWNRWKLERHRGSSESYYICDSDDPRFVMSGDSKRDMSGNHLPVVARKRPGYKMHLWKFESLTPAASAVPATSVPSKTLIQPRHDGPAPPRYRPNPHAEIQGNCWYRVQNVGSGKYFRYDADKAKFYSHTGGTSFKLDYINNSAEFTLRAIDIGQPQYLRGFQQSNDLDPLDTSNTSKVAHLTRKDGWNRWALDWELDQDGLGGCCYYICDSRNPKIVLSGDSPIEFEVGKGLFTIAQKRPGYSGHLWRLKLQKQP